MIDPEELIPIYERNLRAMESDGRDEAAAIQRRLIARLREDARKAKEPNKKKRAP